MGAFHSTQNFGWDIKWNGPFRFGTTRIFGTSLVKVVHFDRSSHFGRSDRNVPFHLTVPLFCILLTRTISKRQRLGSLCNRNVPFHWARGISEISNRNWPRGGGGGGEVLGITFAWYVPLASRSPYPIIVYFVANYRPHLSHVWANM